MLLGGRRKWTLVPFLRPANSCRCNVVQRVASVEKGGTRLIVVLKVVTRGAVLALYCKLFLRPFFSR